MSGALGEAAVHAADSAGSHEADPAEPADGERPADGGRPDRALRGAGGEVARPGLERVGPASPNRSSSSAVRPTTTAPSSTPTVAGTAPSAPDRRLRGEPHLHPHPGREPVGDQGSLERDDGGAVVESLLHFRRDLVRDPSRSSRYGSHLRDAARRGLDAEVDPADDEPRRERVARAGRVDDLARSGARSSTSPAAEPSRRGSRASPPPSRRARRRRRRAPTPARSRRRRRARAPSRRSRKRCGPNRRIALHDERSTLTRALPARASRGRRERGLPRSALPAGCSPERCSHVAADEPGRVELVGTQIRRDAAVGRHRALAVRRRRARRRRPSARRRAARPARPRARSSSDRASSPVSSSACFPTKRASPAERRRPRRDVGGLAPGDDARLDGRVGAGRERLPRAARSRPGAGRRACRSWFRAYNRSMDGRPKTERLRSFLIGGVASEHRPSSPPLASANALARRPAGARGVRGRSVLPRDRRARAPTARPRQHRKRCRTPNYP